MQTEVIIAGFGGQGILFAGQVAGLRGVGREKGNHLDPLLRTRDAGRYRQLHRHRRG